MTGSSPSRRRKRWSIGRLPAPVRRGWATGLSAVVGAGLPVSPVHAALLDRAWTALLVGLAAYLATTAKRGPLLFATIVAVAASRTVGGVALGAVAVAAGVLSTRRLHRRATFVRGLCGGAAMAVALLATRDHQPVVSGLVLAAVLGPILVSGAKRLPRRPRSILLAGAWIGAAVVVVGSGCAALGALQTSRHVDRGASALRLGLAAARQGNVDLAGQALTVAAAEFDRAHHDLDRYGAIGRLIPGVAQHVVVLSDVLDDGEDAADQAARTARSTPIDDLQFRTGRIDPQLIVDLANPFHRLSATLAHMVDAIDDGSSSLLLPPVTHRLDELRTSVVRARDDARAAAAAADAMPTLLGADGPQHYLVLFTSPAEARGRFGFPGSFAEVTFDDGRFELGEHGNTSAVFGQLPAPAIDGREFSDQLRPYLDFAALGEMRSTTIVPDFPTVAEAAARIWASTGRAPVDGVVRFDPQSLAQLMRITGPVAMPTVRGPLNADNLVQFVNFDQYLQFSNDNAARREVLDTVAETTFERLETASLPNPRKLADLFGPLVRDGHLQVETFDHLGRVLFRNTGLDGAFDAPAGDTLLVTNVNSTGNKIDSFLRRSVDYEATVDGDGDLDGTVTITLRNDAPASGLPTYVIGSATVPPLPRGTNRTTLLVYTSVPVARAELDGRPVRMRTDRTAGRWLQQQVVEIAPGREARLVLHLRGEVPRDAGTYHLELLPSGGVRPDAVTVDVALAGGHHVRLDADLSSPVSLR